MKACATREKLITALTHSGTCPQLIEDFARLPNTMLKEWVFMSMHAPMEDDDPTALMRLKLSGEVVATIQDGQHQKLLQSHPHIYFAR